MLGLEVLNAPIDDCRQLCDLGYCKTFRERDAEDGTGLRERVGRSGAGCRMATKKKEEVSEEWDKKSKWKWITTTRTHSSSRSLRTPISHSSPSDPCPAPHPSLRT